MTFKEAFEAMKHGAKVKLPSWAGYWFWCIPAQSILMHEEIKALHLKNKGDKD